MKKFVRLISVCSMVTLGAVAVPLVANAEPAESETVGSAPSALHGRAVRALDEILADVQLSPEQQAEVDQLKAEAKERHAKVKEAKHELMRSLADQIEAGTIDRCELAPKIESVASAMADARPGDREAFQRLHSILEPEQRAKFVESSKQHWESHVKKHSPAMLADKMAKELDLTDDQKDRIYRILSGLREIYEAEPAYTEQRDRWSRILEAFKTDNFNLDEIAPMGDVVAKSKSRIEAHLSAGEAVLPVLTAEQRTRVAEKLREIAGGEHSAPSEQAQETQTAD